MRDCYIYGENGRYVGGIRDNKIYDNSGLFGGFKGEIRGNNIYDENGGYWGTINDNGDVYKGIGLFGEYVGKIKENGDIYKTGEGYAGKVVYRDYNSNSSEEGNVQSSNSIGYSVDQSTLKNSGIGILVAIVITPIVKLMMGFGAVRTFFFFMLLMITVSGFLDYYVDAKKNISKGYSWYKGNLGEIIVFIPVLAFFWILVLGG